MKTGGEVIVIAVDAGAKEITDYAIDWALRNVARNLDSLILLPLLPSGHGGEVANYSPAVIRAGQQQYSFRGMLKKWVMKKLHREENPALPDSATQQEEAGRISKGCIDMIRHLCRIHKKQLQTQVKVIADAQLGSVASAARDLEATWVILDRRLKKEGDICMRQLRCNIVVMEQSVPKVMRTAVNPNRTRRRHSVSGTDEIGPSNMIMLLGASNHTSNSTTTTAEMDSDASSSSVGSTGSLDEESVSSFGKKPSETTPRPLLILNSGPVQEKGFQNSPQKEKEKAPSEENGSSDDVFPPDGLSKSYNGLSKLDKVIESAKAAIEARKAIPPERRSFEGQGLTRFSESMNQTKRRISRRNSLISNNFNFLEETQQHSIETHHLNVGGPSNIEERTSSIRRAMSLSIKPPPIPPPLCSLCKHKAPIFGKPPKKFTYEEVETATDGFASESIVAEGGRGLVYKGKLPNGQTVAVKQYKALTAQGASEFCSEVEVLSCAQHRNLVMLLGYCIEKEWLLVYEYSCNGSLDKHLYGNEEGDEVMAWEHRMKVAIGAARGLRYLHEDCRVGCIVHRDFRPQNVLLTHDFEPMVGDFGLARWQSDGQKAEETRIIGAIGYLAPEYTQAGIITEKADVYAFGMVLLELICGVKAREFSRNMGQNFLQELARWLLEGDVINEIVDSRLQDRYVENEVICMIYASSLCLSPDPETRPRMSKVLKILEGDTPREPANEKGQPGFGYPNQFVNMIYGSDSPAFSKLSNQGTSMMKPKAATANWRRNPSNLAAVGNVANPPPMKTELGGGGEERTSKGSAGDEQIDFSGEYQAYLQGSLAKFFDGLNGHGRTTTTPDEPEIDPEEHVVYDVQVHKCEGSE